jgi:hypothetical protein
VDLVGEDPGAVTLRGRRDRLQFLPRRHGSGRVVGAAEDQRHRSAGELPLDPLDVELRSRQRDFRQLAVRLLDDREEGVIDGRVDRDSVARLGDHLQDRRDRPDDVGAGGDRGGVDLPAVPVRGELSERRAELLRIRVARIVVLDRLQ